MMFGEVRMKWSVTYWENDDTLERDSDHFGWSDLPVEGVLWVDVRHGPYRHRLVGFDNYWVYEADLSFGVFNDPENFAWYPGEQAAAYRWTDNGDEKVTPPDAPPDAHVLLGVLVPDEVAWELGLLRPGEHLPPRPG